MTDLRVSKRGILELVSHEGIVLEAYKDSVGVWTWGIGITNASGHNVDRYRKNPQTLTRVLEIYLWALQRYERDVLEAFDGYDLKEHELAAALSFHYNTGGIKEAFWVDHVKAGNRAKAREAFMNWSNPPEIMPRRKAERDLFFDAKWTGSHTSTIWGVHSNGNVNWSDARTVDLRPALDQAMGVLPIDLPDETDSEAPHSAEEAPPVSNTSAVVVAALVTLLAALVASGLVSVEDLRSIIEQLK